MNSDQVTAKESGLPAGFVFRRSDSIGAVDAEADKQFLEDCFYDSGLIERLQDCENSQCIVLGRTGSGKTALLLTFKERVENAISLEPENLAMTYLTGSTILHFLASIDIHLEMFFKLLWRHVLVTEILRSHLNLDRDSNEQGAWNKLLSFFGTAADKKALEYMRSYGGSFWLDADVRVKEITSNFESKISSSLKAKIPGLSLDGQAYAKLSEEQKLEFRDRAQKVIHEIQIRELNSILELLNKMLMNKQKQYYVVIDKLDENWAPDTVRYKLIRALIDTAKDFTKVENAKVIIALRQDLLEDVFRTTAGPGFQEEKYEDQIVPLNWTHHSLEQVLDLRVNHLVQRQYTNAEVTHADLLPETVRGERPLDYFLERTLMRPRDIILFFNKCIEHAQDKGKIDGNVISEAEKDYSGLRLNSLADEWRIQFPNLLEFVPILQKRAQRFDVSDLLDETTSEFNYNLILKHRQKIVVDDLYHAALDEVENKISKVEFLRILFATFYHVGLVALKFKSNEPFVSSTLSRRNVRPEEINLATRVEVNLTFSAALNVIPEAKKRKAKA
jgi:Cdc6-like AAA superfamily ATPase